MIYIFFKKIKKPRGRERRAGKVGDGERGGREEVGTQRSGYAHSYSCGSREDKDEAGRPVSIPIYVGW